MKSKKQNGFVIELMIVFMLVTFGFCMIVTTFMSTLVTERKLANKEFERQMTLNQIGEYYLRAVEAGKAFPKGNETNYEKASQQDFSWMDDNGDGKLNNDDETVKFFSNCKGKYNFETLYSVKRGGFLEFYATKAVSYKLIVKSGSTVQMVVIVVETRTGSDKADYEVKDWSITDIHSDVEYTKEENLSLLKKLWIWLGNTIEKWEDYFNG